MSSSNFFVFCLCPSKFLACLSTSYVVCMLHTYIMYLALNSSDILTTGFVSQHQFKNNFNVCDAFMSSTFWICLHVCGCPHKWPLLSAGESEKSDANANGYVDVCARHVDCLLRLSCWKADKWIVRFWLSCRAATHLIQIRIGKCIKLRLKSASVYRHIKTIEIYALWCPKWTCDTHRLKVTETNRDHWEKRYK